MSDLVALALKLRPEKGQGRGYLGRAAQAWFLAEVARHDRELAEQLHQGASLRPYTLHLEWEPAPFLRVTSVLPALSAFLLERWLPGLPGWLRLDQVAFEIAGVATQAASHPWAGQARYADLVQGRTGGKQQDVALEFNTPTMFRSNGLDVPLPQPGLVFGNLIQKWECFAPVLLEADLKAWVEVHLAVKLYELRTRLVRFGGNRGDVMGGFVGRCCFTFVGAQAATTQVAQCHALAQFAFYAGVGRRTTMGLGQCRGTEG